MIKESLKKLLNYIEAENFIGFDPYDTLNSWIPFRAFGKWFPILAIQFQKRNPINIRHLLGIKKDYNPKAIGLFLYGYSLLYKNEPKLEYLNKMDFFFRWLADNRSKGFRGAGWGYNFPWASEEKYLESFTPSAVVTGFISRGIYQYYLATKNKEAKALLLDAATFILEELPRYSDKTGICFSYTPLKQDICYNASLLAAEVIAINYQLGQLSEKYKNLCKEAVEFIISRQHPDGVWMYSMDKKTGNERKQVDFHQGYIIESIMNISQWLNVNMDHWHDAVAKGLYYYNSRQFFPEGRSLWRVPKTFPVEIHNQSQGIITFIKAKEFKV